MWICPYAARAGEEVTHTYSRENERNDYSLVNYFFTQVSPCAGHSSTAKMLWLPCRCTRRLPHLHAKYYMALHTAVSMRTKGVRFPSILSAKSVCVPEAASTELIKRVD